MKLLIKLEELAQAIMCIVVLYQLSFDISWWLWILLFLAPDLGMIGYLVNSKFGAITYNLVHHKAVAIILGAFGYFCHNETILLWALIIYLHTSVDRTLGYGLKFSDNFKHTHAGNL